MKTSQIKELLNLRRDICLSESIEFILEGCLDETLAVVGKYTISSHAPVRGAPEKDDIIHVKAHKGKLDDLLIPHPHKIDGEYGHVTRVTVKNNETGATSHHSVYQSGYDEKSKKPVMSIRSYGAPNEQEREHQKEHTEVLAKHLGKKL